MAVGGDIIEMVWNHPTLGSGTIFPKSGEDNTYSVGGFRSNDDANMIAGNGEMIDSMNQTRPYVSVSVANDMNGRKDIEGLVALASSPIAASWTITIINGINYAGQLKPVGDIEGNINKATFSLKLAGGGTLKQI